MSPTKKKYLKSVVGVTIGMVSIYYIIDNLKHPIDHASIHINRIDHSLLALSVVLGALMLFASGFTFYLLATPDEISQKPAFRTCQIYLIAQIIKYLPGKIWGIIYQIQKTSQETGRDAAITATFNHSAIGILISLISYSAASNSEHKVLILCTGIAITFFWIKRGGVIPYWNKLKKRNVDNNLDKPWRILFVCASTGIEWLFYLSTWVIIVKCTSLNMQFCQVIALALIYSGSWIISGIASLTPGGIGIREVAFLATASTLGFESTEVVVASVIARLVFTLSELASGGVSFFLFVRSEK